MKSSYVSHFLSLCLFFFPAFLSFYVFIYSYKSLDLGIDQTDLLVH